MTFSDYRKLERLDLELEDCFFKKTSIESFLIFRPPNVSYSYLYVSCTSLLVFSPSVPFSVLSLKLPLLRLRQHAFERPLPTKSKHA